MSAEVFVDTNVALYLLSGDQAKAGRAEEVLRANCVVSVQVLNEIANVARRKLAMTWRDTNDFIDLVRGLCSVRPLTEDVHDRGRALAERHQLSVYDAMIVASALEAGCTTLFSEDMHAGLRVDAQLRIVNPFARASPSPRPR
jgi:predicted nucleic acid-binding protein